MVAAWPTLVFDGTVTTKCGPSALVGAVGAQGLHACGDGNREVRNLVKSKFDSELSAVRGCYCAAPDELRLVSISPLIDITERNR
jgi:hypothetical protein